MTTNQLQRYTAVGGAAIVAWKLRASSSGDAGAFADAGGIVIPAQEAAEEGLRLRARVEPRKGGRTVRLEIGSGAATLELDGAACASQCARDARRRGHGRSGRSRSEHAGRNARETRIGTGMVPHVGRNARVARGGGGMVGAVGACGSKCA